jgi:helicase
MSKKPNDSTMNLVIDTISKGKQALVFVNSKQRAEKTAEDIAHALKIQSKELDDFSESLGNCLENPTKQCKRLALCAKKGIVFHHAGLLAKQRGLIEDNFITGLIKIICCTPTLALGVDLPAFRTIIKDVKRYSSHGYNWIPVMEYHQMAGRAGRPGKEKTGEAIIEASTEEEQEEVIEKYIRGLPESILSKLAVEPVLRTYILSLIATGFVMNKKQIFDFFSRTFWAHQYGDMKEIRKIIERMLSLLEENKFIEIKSKSKGDFVPASELDSENKDSIEASLLGKRIAELYIDPLSAVDMIDTLEAAKEKEHRDITFLYMICRCLEMRPLARVKVSEFEKVQEKLVECEEYLIADTPEFGDDYDDHLSAFKTAMILQDWIDEKDEEFILEKYKIRPGELNMKLNNSDWLIYSAEEIAKIIKAKSLLSVLSKLRVRIQYGAKEELLTLLKLKNIGRVRARKLCNAGFTDLGKLRKADINILAKTVGKSIAVDVKNQLGEAVDEAKIKKTGQQTISDY